MEKDGRLWIVWGEGSRRVRLWSTGLAPWLIGGSIRAVVAVVWRVYAAMSVLAGLGGVYELRWVQADGYYGAIGD